MALQLRQVDDYVSVGSSQSFVASSDEMAHYPAIAHARRVAAKLAVTQGLIFLPGQQSKLLEDSDQNVPFRQLRYFYYLSGVDEPDCALTYDIAKDELILYITIVSPERAVWNGPGLTIREAEARYDIDEAKSIYDLKADLVDWIYCNHGAMYVLHPAQKPSLERYLDPDFFYDSTSLQYAMDSCRVIKDEYELKLLRKANDVAAAAHTEVLRQIHNITNERQVQAVFEGVCTAAGSTSQAYHVIAGSGPNSAVLHYMTNNEDLGDRHMFLLDAGPDWHCYASDVTRTFPISGVWPDKECEEIYYLVDKMQSSVIDRLAPGVRFRDMNALAEEIMTLGLIDLGVFKSGYSITEIIKSGAARIFLPHGIGHHIGLEVHDVSPAPITGVLSPNCYQCRDEKVQSTEVGPHHYLDADEYVPPKFAAVPPLNSLDAVLLEENMVITVEPGVYFSAIALEQLVNETTSKYIDMVVARKYLPVGGVRIEDDVLITRDGHEVITTAPKGEAALKIIRGEL